MSVSLWRDGVGAAIHVGSRSLAQVMKDKGWLPQSPLDVSAVGHSFCGRCLWFGTMQMRGAHQTKYRSCGNAACWGMQTVLLVASSLNPTCPGGFTSSCIPSATLCSSLCFGDVERRHWPWLWVDKADMEEYLFILVPSYTKATMLSAEISWPGSSLPTFMWHSHLQTCTGKGAPAAGRWGSSYG